MPKPTARRGHLKAVPSGEPIELAGDPASWRKLNDRIEKAVNDICGSGDFEAVDALLLIADLLGNPQFDSVCREGVMHSLQTYAFRYTRDGDRALQDYLDRLNPVRKRRAS